LQDTQLKYDALARAELSIEKNAYELRASRNMSELLG
jgi:hypothetical protein